MERRDISIDGMKGTLVILMILAHIVQFFPSGKIGEQFSLYVNLTTFSGFMFTFGYVCYKAYIAKDLSSSELRNKLIKNFLKTLLAFYISGIGYSVLIRNDFSISTIIKIIMLWNIPGYSEFLLSFALIYPLVLFLKHNLEKMETTGYIILAVISWLMTFFRYEVVKIPIIGVIIGTTIFPSFPIIQYFTYFLAGMFLAKKNKICNVLISIVAVTGSSAFILYYTYYEKAPSRFPPSIIWISGGYIFILAYFVIWKKYSKYLKKSMLHIIGQETLAYLVISNIIIFAIHRMNMYHLVSTRIYGKMLFYFTCFIICIGVPALYCKYRKISINQNRRISVSSREK